MTASLLAAAAALVLWSDDGTVRRTRLGTVLGRGPDRGPALLRSVPLAPSAAAVAALTGALVSTPLVALLGGGAAFIGARSWLAARAARGHEGRLRVLAEGLAALAADLRSGRSLEAATAAAVASCGDDACGPALARAIRAPDAPRPGSEEPEVAEALDRVASAVRLSARTGCSLAAVAGAVEDDLRARQRHRRELRSATAGPRASASLLAGLPLLGLAMGHGVGADPWGVLTGTAVGQVLLVGGIALEAAGLAWSRRLVAGALR